MSDTPINNSGEDVLNNLIVLRQPCKVAYTLNNGQPVQSTIIGDQPFFYMDAEEDYDEELFNEEELALLEHEVTALKSEIEELERFSGMFDGTEEKKFIDFGETINEITGTDKKSKAEFDLDKLQEILSKSRLAQSYLDCVSEYDVKMMITSQTETAFYDRKAGTIQINPNLDLETATLLCVQELRRHWQHRQGALIHPLQFQPDNAIIINRVQIADLTTSMVRVAWELQLGGYKEIWERLEHSSMADLAHAFAREAFLDFRTINNGEAATAVFEAWFLSDRCRSHDKVIVQQMLADYQNTIFDVDTVLGGVGAEIIAAIGAMPFGKNYLAKHSATVLSDPIFTDVRDRSNANFLWFIKFERSFRETEHELQTDNASTNRDSHSGSQHKNWSIKNGGDGTAQVITLHADKSGSSKSISTGKSAEIVQFKRRSFE